MTIAAIGCIAVAFGCGIVAVSLVALAAYRMHLADRQMRAVMEERRLLIERGVTDLPPLEPPRTAPPTATEACFTRPRAAAGDGPPPSRNSVRWILASAVLTGAAVLVALAYGDYWAVLAVLAAALVGAIVGLAGWGLSRRSLRNAAEGDAGDRK
jgi:hypothetical protein